MNYYEELGVSREATGEEIRKAHRRLVKLMHPDAQLDQGLKSLAETQMRRLNSIVSTLLDSDQRRAYDEQLWNESLAQPAGNGRAHWRGVPWWLASTAGAVILTLVAVWLWADHLSNSFRKSNHTIYVRPADAPPIAASEKPPEPTEVPETTSAAKVADPQNDFPTPSPDAHSLPDPREPSGGVSATVVNSDAHSELAPQKSDSVAVVPPAAKPTPQTTSKPVKVAPAAHAPAPSQSADFPLVVHKPAHSSVDPSTTRSDMAAAQPPKPKPAIVEPPKKTLSLPTSSLVGQEHAKDLHAAAQQTPQPTPAVTQPTTTAPREEPLVAMNGTPPLPLALAPKVEGGSIPASVSKSGAGSRPRDPLEGEWIYAPKEPERRKAGFYPPEFIDLKLFSAGDPGNLRGQYNARYVITDKPIAPEVSFQLASVDKDSRKFVWQGTNGSRGTVAIHPVDDNTIRIEWRTTTSVRGPALTSGAATLVRRP